MADIDDGLAYDPDDDGEPDLLHDVPTDIRRDQAEALQSRTPLEPDLGSRARFEPEPDEVDFGAIGARFAAPDDGLTIGADGHALRDDLAKLKEHTADLKLRALLDKAEQALGAKRFEKAWTHVTAALQIAPKSVAALLLGARCQYSLGQYETALDLLTTARLHARRANEVTPLLRLRGVCELRLVDMVSRAARGLLRHNGPAAVEFVERKVARHPELLELSYIFGVVLSQTGHLPRAREVVEAVLARDAGAATEAFAELRLGILAKLYAPTLELARRSLRAGQSKTAIEQLMTCGDALTTGPRYERAWSYAHDRYARSAKLPFVGRRRARRADAKPLDAEELQRTLMWLLAEEVDAAMDALRESDLARAARCCENAAVIDTRCGAVAYLHAMAETTAAARELHKIDVSTLAAADRHLATAARLVGGVQTDPALAKQGQMLAARISADRADVARTTRLFRCVNRFNSLMRRYEHRRTVTPGELLGIKSNLRSIQAATRASKREHEPTSPWQRTLDDLLRAIDSVLRSLPR